ncbi:MAG: hypothetical protein JW966_04765 [Anaerolineae bacterium]|nr:hypothetical protein [Anaerolineae bacterium]
MAWTSPKTWEAGELVTATLFNTHLRDNLNALKSPPSQQILRDNSGNYTTTSTSFVAIDSTNLKCTITTNGGDVLVWFVGSFSASVAGYDVGLDIRIDGTTRLGSDFTWGLAEDYELSTNARPITLGPVIVSGLDAGEHSFEIMWRTASGQTAQLRSDAGQVPAILVAREVS